MKFRPLHDRVLIRRVEQEAKTTGGIIIPDTAQEKPMEGEVIAVGPGARGEDGKVHPLDLKTGDRVLFGKWSGTEVRLDGEELDKATQALRHQVRPQHNDHDHCGDERRPTCQTGTVRQNHARRYSSTIGCATPMRATRPGHKIDTWQTQSLKRVEASCRPQVPSPSLAETANSSGSDLKRR